MNNTTVIIEKTREDAILPRKAHATDSCYDLSAPDSVLVPPHGTAVVDLGLAIQLEEGWEAQIRGRSGLASRGLVVHPGTIDHLYRLPLKMIVHNLSAEAQCFEAGQRLAQMKIDRVWNVTLTEGAVQPTMRGGLGSTGLG
jgi:dUTP pyrophosphatase